MKTTCLINNYNYETYVVEAVASAMAQTRPFDEIIVVDDGSTDGSIAALRERYPEDPKLKIVVKPNGGQLSAFNAGAAACTGDLVFFLDADDLLEEHHVERVVDIYGREPAPDFTYCKFRLFGEREGDGFIADGETSHDLGYSVLATLHLGNWVRAPTSCISMRRWVLDALLPLEFERHWRTRADECLVFGASIVGARKHYLAESLTRYRVHGDNAWFGTGEDPGGPYADALATHRMFHHLARRMDYDLAQLARYAHWEYASIGRPTYRQLKLYRRICMRAPLPLWTRLRMVASLYKHFFKGRR